MSNKNLFPSAGPPPADTRNNAGGKAYAMPAKHALAQFAATGCLNDTYYTKAEDQLAEVLKLAAAVPAEFVAKTALYAREKGAMKDMPALLTAFLATKEPALARKVFPRTVDNGRQVRSFVQMIRSGALGRKSLGTAPKKMVQSWFDSRTPEQIFRNSIGDKPSLADVIKLAHPKPTSDERRALHAYLLGKEHDDTYLPRVIKDYERFKRAPDDLELPRVPFEMLVGLPLNDKQWRALALQASWTQLRMNLNTFARHGVFADPGVTKTLADRLRNADEIRRARPMPYQLLMAYLMVDTGVPTWVQNALQDAMEVAVENVPALDGGVVVCPDHSGSMDSPVTGARGTATSKVTCKLVAALIASAIMRRNQDAGVLPFASKATPTKLNPRDSIMTNATILGRLPSGGTNCAAPLEYLNATSVRAKTVIMVSDNESWIDRSHVGWGFFTPKAAATNYQVAWDAYKRRVSGAKLICIDLAPNSTVQAKDSASVLNIGGFSDAVFDQVARFVNGTMPPDHWVGVIDGMSLTGE